MASSNSQKESTRRLCSPDRRISRSGEHSLRQRGFSLLEILAVLIVIVIVTSMVTLAVNSGSQDILLESKVRNFSDVASYALDEAQMSAQNYGVLLHETYEDGERIAHYDWYRLQLDGWSEVSVEQDVFVTTSMPPDIELELELEQSPLSESSLDDNSDEDEERINPQLIFYASGEMTEGALNVRRRDNSELLWRIEWDLLGRFTVLRRGEVNDDLERESSE